MADVEKFFARRDSNPRHGDYFSLRIVFATSCLPGDRSVEFGRLRKERGGWNARADDEALDGQLKAACFRAGRDSALAVVLAEVRQTYLDWYEREFGQKLAA